MKALVTYRSANSSKVTTMEESRTFDAVLPKKLKKSRLFAGDFVEGKIVGDKFVIEAIKPRKNLLVRPPVANVDSALIVVSMKEPDFDNYLLDNFLAVYEYKGLEPVIVFNKTDLLKDKKELKKWMDIYQKAGYIALAASAFDEESLKGLKNFIKGHISIVAGPSGVGKSSILSRLLGKELKTGQVSQKLGRGRHTTTHITLYPFGENSFIADTPGFSRVEATYFMDKKDVRLYFKEFLPYGCKYHDCTHTNEPGCKVKEAVKRGEISCERFKSYLKIMGYYWDELNRICH